MNNPAASPLIRHGRIETPQEALIADDADPAALPDQPGQLVRLQAWLAHSVVLRNRQHPVGIVLGLDDEPADLADPTTGKIDPQGIALIAIDIPSFIDGRGFTIGEMLRSRYGWQGELRAMGDVFIDTVHYLARCGFTSFLIKEGHDPVAALQALNTFSEHYQHGYAEIPT